MLAAAALLVAAAGLWAVWLRPGPAIALLRPALSHAEREAAISGHPVATWDLTGDGRPDLEAPMVDGLVGNLPDDVTVRLFRFPIGEGPQRGTMQLVEVERDGYLDVACLRLRRPALGVVRWEIEGLPLSLRRPFGAGCDTAVDRLGEGAGPELTVERGRARASGGGVRS